MFVARARARPRCSATEMDAQQPAHSSLVLDARALDAASEEQVVHGDAAPVQHLLLPALHLVWPQVRPLLMLLSL